MCSVNSRQSNLWSKAPVLHGSARQACSEFSLAHLFVALLRNHDGSWVFSMLVEAHCSRPTLRALKGPFADIDTFTLGP